MRVSVIVATYNRERVLEGTLAALAGQRVPDGFEWETVVVDNASRDGTAETVRKFAQTAPIPVRLVFEGRPGVSHARNRGVHEARAGILAFTDDDVLPAPDWVAQIPVAMERWDAEGVGGRILPRWEAPPPDWLAENERLLDCLALMDEEEGVLLSLPRRSAATVWGPNMAFRREVFERAGEFDPGRGIVGEKLARGEEVDLIERALAAGCRIAYDPALVVFHRIGPDRMRRSYFRKLIYEDARAAARRTPASGRHGSFLGAPLGLYGTALRRASTCAALTLLRRPRAFDAQLSWLECAGRLSGYWASRFRPSEGASRSEIAST